MSYIQRIILLFVLLATVLHTSGKVVEYGKPCSVRESINITGATLDNGNLVYEGVVYNSSWYAYYDYEIDKDENVVRVAPHVRGCICAVKGYCARFCCDPSKEACPHQYDGFFEDHTQQISYTEHFGHHVSVVFGLPFCPAFMTNYSDPNDNFTVRYVRKL